MANNCVMLGHLCRCCNKIRLLNTYKCKQNVLKCVDYANYVTFCESCKGGKIMRDCNIAYNNNSRTIVIHWLVILFYQ